MTQLALALPISVLKRNRETWDSEVYFLTDIGQQTIGVYIQLWVGRCLGIGPDGHVTILAPLFLLEESLSLPLGLCRVESCCPYMEICKEITTWPFSNVLPVQHESPHIPATLSHPNGSCHSCAWPQSQHLMFLSWARYHTHIQIITFIIHSLHKQFTTR